MSTVCALVLCVCVVQELLLLSYNLALLYERTQEKDTIEGTHFESHIQAQWNIPYNKQHFCPFLFI